MFTDYFGQPVAVGDEIVYPESSGSSRACYGRYPIEKIVPLIPHRANPTYLMREDQRGNDSPTYYSPIDDPNKRYVVQVSKSNQWSPNNSKLFTIRFTDNIIKVP